MHILIAGGTGFLGSWLIKYLTMVRPTWRLTVVTRSDATSDILNAVPFENEPGQPQIITWDLAHVANFQQTMAKQQPVDVVINLCGKNVNCRKTPGNADAILRSRVDATRALRQTLSQQVPQPPTTWLQMSTAHIYGDPAEKILTETDHPGLGLAPTVGQAWEQACYETTWQKDRTVVLRTGFVLADNDGPMPLLTRLAKLGLGGPVGNGRQGMSWLHIADFCHFCLAAMENPTIAGVVNLCAPQPVSQKVFMHTLRRHLRQPIGLPGPAPAVRIASRRMNTDPELILLGHYVKSARIPAEFFTYETLEKAVRELDPSWRQGFQTRNDWLNQEPRAILDLAE